MSWVSRLFGEKKPRSEADLAEAAAAPAPAPPPAPAPAGTTADIEVWMGKARQEFRKERYAASLSSIQAQLEIDPRHAAAWQLKGGVLAKLQRFEEAALAVEEYLRLAPDSEADKVQSARSFLRNLRWVNTADNRLDVEGLCGKAVTLHQFGQSAEAVRCFDRALSIDPKSLQAWNDRALALEALGSKEDAIASYDHALELQPNAAAVWFNRANLLANLSRGAEAVECYRRFVAIAPPELQHLLPDANARIAQLDRAAAPVVIDPVVIERCKGLRACEYPAVLNMTKTYLNMFGLMKPSTLDCIIADTRKLLDLDPQDHGALALLGYATLAMHRAGDGEPYFKRARDSASGAAALCGAYFHTLTAFRNRVQEGNSEAAGKAIVDGMLSSVEAFADQTALQLDLKSMEFGHCVIVSTAHGGLVVPVQGHEARFMSIDLATGYAIEVIGTALVKQVFPFGDQTVAGCQVTQGELRSGQPVLVHRGAEVVYQGSVRSLKQSSNRVERVGAGQECGVLVDPSGALGPPGQFDGFAVGDIVKSYTDRYVGAPETRPVELAMLWLRSLLGGVDEEAALGKLYAEARYLEGYEYHDVHRNKQIRFLRGGRVCRDIQTRVSLRKGAQPVLEHDWDSRNNRAFRVPGADTELLELIERVERRLQGRYTFTLYPCSTERVGISAACINADRPIPGVKDKFQGVARVPDGVARFLAASRGEDPMVIQAGVWTLTDGYTHEAVINHLIARDRHGKTTHPITDRHCDQAQAILDRLGLAHRL